MSAPSESAAVTAVPTPKMALQPADAWSDCAEKYESSSTAVTVPHSRWLLDWVLNRARTAGQKDLVLADIACGTGAMVLSAAAHPDVFSSVIGSDFSAGMCARVEAAAKALPSPHVPVRTVVSDAARLEAIPSNSVDVASCIFGIMLLPDPLAATKELLRITKPGGLLVFGTWMPQPSQFHGLLFGLMKYISSAADEEDKKQAGPAPAPAPAGSALPVLPYSRVEQFESLFSSLGLEPLLITPHHETTPLYKNMAEWWRAVQGSAPMFNEKAGGERGVRLAEQWAKQNWGADAPFSLTATSLLAIARKPL